ncbi:hypothetical protein L2E82_30380 [Cichorium intybus]|uniref:Uncharacterized protein n=1 Tax=Cichorium intybus TaxID=13427 RepID=A0ACB9D0C0_CICIN|nr:hypothetical protein L2E82_30380 [Cichorium intybus]
MSSPHLSSLKPTMIKRSHDSVRYWSSQEARCIFCLPKDNELRLVAGDELRLRYSGDAAHLAWQSVGHVIKLTAQEKVALELHASQVIEKESSESNSKMRGVRMRDAKRKYKYSTGVETRW